MNRPDATALVYSFLEWPLFQYLQPLVKLPLAQLDHGCWLLAKLPGVESNIFELLPEPVLPARVAAEGLEVARQLYRLYEVELRGGLWPASFDGSYHYGFHASERFEPVRKAFEKDGFRVVTLAEWRSELYTQRALPTEAERRDSLARRLSSGLLESAPALDAARALALRYALDGGDKPEVAAGTFPEGWLEQSLDPYVERWTDFDERLLDVIVANASGPQNFHWFVQTHERGIDRHRLLREALAARGCSPAWILAASVRGPAWASRRVWVVSHAIDLDAALALLSGLRTKAQREAAVKGLMAALMEGRDLPGVRRAVKRWAKANPAHPSVEADTLTALKKL